jgi:hypothetical protein
MKEKGFWRHRSRPWREAAVLRGAVVGAAGILLLCRCVYDPDDRCDPGQVFNGSACVCPAGAVMQGGGLCVACGANEAPSGNSCECATGFSRPSADAACAPNPANVGTACDTTSTPCTDPVYGYCQVVAGTSGYCTIAGCASSQECTAGYQCDTSGSPSYCRRPPSGLDAPCTSSTDCAGFDATFCDTYSSRQCYVQGCTMSPDNCFPGYACCDLSSLGFASTLCLPEGSCPT